MRQTVHEIVRYEKATTTFVVASRFGTASDWYRIIQAQPQVVVQCRCKRWSMITEFLSPEQSAEEILDYARRHPMALRELASFMGYRLDGSQERFLALERALAIVAFHPS